MKTSKSKFLTFIFSAVPGLGHYYLGQMNRGLQIMILFFGSIFLFNLVRLNGAFPFIMPVIWFYSLFDALQQNQTMAEKGEFVDPPLFSWDNFKVKKPWIGWGLIGLGAYLILDRLTLQFGWHYNDFVMSTLTAIAFIVLGWYLLTGKKISMNKKNIEGDLTNSFLRNRGPAFSICIDCHRFEALLKYKGYHQSSEWQQKYWRTQKNNNLQRYQYIPYQ